MTMVTAAMFMVMVGGHRGQGGPWSVVMGSKDTTIGVDVHPKYVAGVGTSTGKTMDVPKNTLRVWWTSTRGTDVPSDF